MMSMLRIALVASMFSLVFGLPVGPVAAQNKDVAAPAGITGTWTLTVESPNGTGNPVFNLKQEGEKITGTYKGALGEAPVTGTLKGKDLTISFKTSGGQAGEQTVEYTGTVEGATMKGKVKLGALGEGTFTGKKN
jgi:hypothetical protein